MSSIVVLRQDDRRPDAAPALWELDPALLDTLCTICDQVAACGSGARLVTVLPRQVPQTLVSARWKSANWRPLADTVLDRWESLEQGELAGAPVQGPGGLRAVLLFAGAEADRGRRELVSAFAAQVEAALAHAEIRLSSGGSIAQSMLQMISAHDQETGRHSSAVKRLSLVLGKELGLSALELLTVERSALLHDIGKIGVPQHVLAKAGPLTSAEWALMREHPAYGERIVRAIPELQNCAPAIRHHHERWNGTGYPDRLSGSAIPLEARIIALVDAYETMRAGRTYRSACARDDALAELHAGAATQFDPTLVETFSRIPYHVLGL